MASHADSAAYADAQAALLRALIGGDAPPDGFDAAKAAVASRSLWRKRAHAVAAAWPALALGLGDRFDAAFEAYARAMPPPATGHGLADGLAFARALPRADLTQDGRVELLLARAVLCERGVCAGAVRLRDPWRVLVVLRAPVIGRRRFAVALGRGASAW